MKEDTAGATTGNAWRFRAFISYSHADTRWGEWLSNRLETYQLPASLVGTNNRDGATLARGLGKVFRDRDELGPAKTLEEAIREALERSDNLIVVCSPLAARSSYVNDEIVAFKKSGRGDRVYALIVGGEPNAARHPDRALEECLPAALRYTLDEAGKVSTVPAPEILAADARPHADGKRRALLKLIAGLLRIDFDLLHRRDERRRRQRLIALASVVLVAMTAMSVLGWQAWTSRRDAVERGRLNRHDAYVAALKLSEQEYRAHDATRTLATLATQEPRAGDEDLREFAWRYLWQIHHAERAVTSLGGLVYDESTHLAVSDDGRSVAVGGKNGPVVVLDSDGKERFRITAHGNEAVTGLAFLRDGTLVTGGEDGTVRFFKPGTADERRLIKANDAVRSFLLSADGTMLALDAPDGFGFGTVTVHDLTANTSAKVEFLGQRGQPTDWFFAPDGKSLAIVYQGGSVVVHDARTGAIHAELKSDGRGALELAAVSPDGRTLAMAMRGGPSEVRLLDRESGRVQRVMRIEGTEDNAIAALEFSRDGQTIVLATGGADILSPEQHSKVVGWDVASGRRQFVLEQEDTGFASLLALAPDGRTFATAGKDNTVRLWNIDGTLRNVLGVHGDTVWRAAFAAKAPMLVTVSRDGKARFWDLGVAPELIRIPQPGTRHEAFAFSPDGKRIATGDDEGIVEVWELTSPSPVKRARLHATRIGRLAFSQDGGLLASAAWDGVVRVADSQTLGEIRTYETAADSRPEALAFVGEWIVSFAARPLAGSGELRVWDTKASGKAGEVLVTRATVVAVSPDGRRFAWFGGYSDGTGHCRLTVRDQASRSSRVLTTCERGARTFTHISFSPDSRYLAAGGPEVPSRGGKTSGAVVYDLRDLSSPLALQFPVTFNSGSALAALEFSPHGTLLATAGAGRSEHGPYADDSKAEISLWHLPSGQLEKAFIIPGDELCGGAIGSSCIRHVRFVLDEEKLMVVRGAAPPQWGQHTIALYGVHDGSVRSVTLTGRVEAISLAAPGATIPAMATLHLDAPVLLWDANRLSVTRTFGHANPGVESIAFDTNGAILATIVEYGMASPPLARVWNLSHGNEIDTHERGPGPVAAYVSADGRIAALIAPDRRIHLRALDDGRLIAELPIPAAKPSPLERTDRTLRFWPAGVLANVHDSETTLSDAATGAPRATIKGRFAALSADARLAVTVSDCNTARIIKVASGSELASMRIEERCVDAAVFSPDGASVLTLGTVGGNDPGETADRAVLWDTETGELRVVLDEFNSDLALARFSPDGRTLATAGRKGTVDLWNPANGRRLMTFDGPDSRTALVARDLVDLAFSADGETLAVAYPDQVRVWRAPHSK